MLVIVAQLNSGISCWAIVMYTFIHHEGSTSSVK